MAAPNEKLAKSLDVLKALQGEGDVGSAALDDDSGGERCDKIEPLREKTGRLLSKACGRSARRAEMDGSVLIRAGELEPRAARK